MKKGVRKRERKVVFVVLSQKFLEAASLGIAVPCWLYAEQQTLCSVNASTQYGIIDKPSVKMNSLVHRKK